MQSIAEEILLLKIKFHKENGHYPSYLRIGTEKYMQLFEVTNIDPWGHNAIYADMFIHIVRDQPNCLEVYGK